MKRPNDCLMKVEKCEDCRYWEPIPFHHRGGECIPADEMPGIKIFAQVPSKKVPVKV